tara:strand:- start:56 stop:877 length:822 start_codon:yes stop_codon:yes gene_type:complete
MKHNYTLAKERELKLVECLNGNLNDHKFNQIADYIINKLGHQFDSFSHSGSIQTEPGDILGDVKNKKIPIEIKILDTGKSTYSHGGISGDFFKILSPEIQGYREFESVSGVEQHRWDIVSNKLNVKINDSKNYIQYEKQVKLDFKLKENLVNLTNQYKIIYLDNLVKKLENVSQELLLNVCNSIFKGFRKSKDVIKYSIKNDIIEVQVGNFLNDNITITHKRFTPKTKIVSIKRNGYALQIEFESGYLKFPLVHGNGYQGSGRTRSFKCMFTY